MRYLRILIATWLMAFSSITLAAYPCPDPSSTGGGWTPQECSQPSSSSQSAAVSGYSCPAANDSRGGWTPNECSQKKAACADCGIIEKINVVENDGGAIGAAAGAVVGGLIGNQVSKGKNRKLGTVLGAAAGGVGGYYGEKYLRKKKRWDVIVLMDDGTHRTVEYDQEPGLKVGDKVKVSGDSLTRQ